MNWRIKSVVFLMTGALGGCLAPQEGGGESEAKAAGQVQTLKAPPTMKDEMGRVWVRTKEVDPNAAPWVPPDPSKQRPRPSIDELSDEQLEEILNPAMLYMGHEYRLANGAMSAVRRARSGELANGTPSFIPKEIEVEHPPQAFPGSEDRQGRLVFGSDNRQRPGVNVGAYPFSTIAAGYCTDNDSDGDCEDGIPACTFTRIGPETMITAAHCIHNQSSFFAVPSLIFSADHTTPGTITSPFTVIRGDGILGDGIHPECYVAWVPGAWVDPAWYEYSLDSDIAVIRLLRTSPSGNACTDPATINTGWLGVRPNVNPDGRLSWLYGYPWIVDEDGDAPARWNCYQDCTNTEPELGQPCPTVCDPQPLWDYPTMFGIGNTTVSDNDWVFHPNEVVHEIDASDGQSGSSIFALFSDTFDYHADPSFFFPVTGQGYYVYAVHHGSYDALIDSKNFGPHIDYGWMAFLVEYGGLPATNHDPCGWVCEGYLCYCSALVGF